MFEEWALFSLPFFFYCGRVLVKLKQHPSSVLQGRQDRVGMCPACQAMHPEPGELVPHPFCFGSIFFPTTPASCQPVLLCSPLPPPTLSFFQSSQIKKCWGQCCSVPWLPVVTGKGAGRGVPTLSPGGPSAWGFSLCSFQQQPSASYLITLL